MIDKRNDQDAQYSIGDLARATGISEDTLRVWERRYGRPRPMRLPSGHRRYSQDQVRWLRRVSEAISSGHRPSLVVKAADRELDLLLQVQGKTEAPLQVEALLGAARKYRSEDIRSWLESEWKKCEPAVFFDEKLCPLLRLIGRAWADGKLQIRHEHFISELVGNFLREKNYSLDRSGEGRPLLLAALENEEHGLPLQMAAFLARTRGQSTRVIGVKTPNPEIVSAARECKARAILISVSQATGGVETDRKLAELRKEVPENIPILVGGSGARGVRRGPRGIDYLETVKAFQDWLGKGQK